jgi:hypothetical protein
VSPSSLLPFAWKLIMLTGYSLSGTGICSFTACHTLLILT